MYSRIQMSVSHEIERSRRWQYISVFCSSLPTHGLFVKNNAALCSRVKVDLQYDVSYMYIMSH